MHASMILYPKKKRYCSLSKGRPENNKISETMKRPKSRTKTTLAHARTKKKKICLWSTSRWTVCAEAEKSKIKIKRTIMSFCLAQQSISMIRSNGKRFFYEMNLPKAASSKPYRPCQLLWIATPSKSIWISVGQNQLIIIFDCTYYVIQRLCASGSGM